jgi:DNA-binding HxlR family transcriptional regulator
MTESKPLKVTALQSREAIELVADKWRIAILHLLQRNGSLRTHQLQRAIEQVSPKMLTQTLRGLERDGLVNRELRQVAPPHVEYRLTKMGKSVIKPMRGLCRWAEAHVAERDAARARFDTEANKAHSDHRLRYSKRPR